MADTMVPTNKMAASRAERLSNSPFPNYFHRAVRVRDMEATRHFYEDLVGLPLVGCEAFTHDHATGKPTNYIHTFFALGDGSYLAFFQFDDDRYPYVERTSSYMDHHAITVRKESLIDDVTAKVKAQKIFHIPVEDPICKSVYIRDPDGDLFELAYLREGCADSLESDDAHERLRTWLAEHGGRQVVIPRPARRSIP